MNKKLIKDLIPPILLKKLTGLHHGWYGNFRSWNEALSRCDGYNARTVLEKVRNATDEVLKGTAAYERDSYLFDHIEYSYPVLAALLWIAGQEKGNLNVLDFGGSLGSTYYQNRGFLDDLNLNWCIVEQPEFVKLGRELYETDQLHFYNSVDECFGAFTINVVLFSSVLQYLKNPFKLLDEVLHNSPGYILVDRTPFITGKDRLTIQKADPRVYKSSYPCWFFNKEKFLLAFEQGYSRILEFEALDVANIRSEFRGFFFVRTDIKRALKDA